MGDANTGRAAFEAAPAEDDGRTELWFLAWPRALGLAPVWAGVAIAAVVVAAVLGADSLAGPIAHQRATFERRVPVLTAGFFVLVIAQMSYFTRGAQQDFDAMRPRLRGAPDEIARARRALSHHGRTASWVVTLIGVATMAAIQEVNVQRWSRFASGDWNAFDLCAAPSVLLFGAVGFQGLFAAVSTAQALARLGSTLVDVRLFDPELGRPFARFGLRAMLQFALIPALFSVFFQVLSPGVSSSLIFVWALSVAASCACFLLPSVGLRSRVRQLKRAELERVDRAVHGDRSALSASPMREHVKHLELVDLLAYRREVDAIREWPIDSPVLGRFALYLILPPASWIASALVERLVDHFVIR